MKILMVLTSHDRPDDTGRKTDFWLEEFAAPYYVFKDAGAEVVVTSLAGGQPPVDPKSEEQSNQTPETIRPKQDSTAHAHVVVHGRLIARQNPASSQPAAHALVSILSSLVEPGTALAECEAACV